MAHDVYVFGDSHWRVFFPFINHGAATDNVSHEERGIRTIDTIANELSGATMYGLLNPNSKNGARNRILSTIDRLGGVDNVGLVFGEVDARYHSARYYKDGAFLYGKYNELISRYMRFIEEDLLYSGRVRQNVFVYHGFTWPKGRDTLLQPGQPIGDQINKASWVNMQIGNGVYNMCSFLSGTSGGRVHFVGKTYVYDDWVSDDGVHLIPEKIYPMVLEKICEALMMKDYDDQNSRR